MPRPPNILLITADDHAAAAIGCYGSRVNRTPWIDRIAVEGMRFDRAACTNSLCSPSRATLLTGTYSHVHGVTTLSAPYDARQPAFPALLQDAGYRTALVGKWHLGHGHHHDPRGFDHWAVLPDQGAYHDPEFLTVGGGSSVHRGYVTDVITDLALGWLDSTFGDPRPWCLLVQHKAPHRSWEPAPRHAHWYEDADFAVPDTFFDDYQHRASAAREARMRIDRDLSPADLKEPVPAGLVGPARSQWMYRRFLTDYLRCVAAVDESVGRLLDWLDRHRADQDTVVVYTSDQGFFLGEHGWYDKRFMFAESLRIPLLVRYPAEVAPESGCDEIVLNVDLAPTLLDLAGAPVPARMQGRSARELLRGTRPTDWRQVGYYRYWEHLDGIHRVGAHCGIWTREHKLVHYYGDGGGQPGASGHTRTPEWELFDLEQDPREMHSRYDDPAYAAVAAWLRGELLRQIRQVGDEPPASLDRLIETVAAGGEDR
ncbi:MAG TPA: sulfatase [Jiangellaceae bacterium]|nr:sulfatase [Jiangellaceae bacterium]